MDTVYRELADHYESLGQSSMRDRFLMLAADAALAAGQPAEAERLRQRLLTGNRHHMLRPYGSYEEASRAADVQAYLDGLRSNYPADQARDLLASVRGVEATPAPPGAIPPTMPPGAIPATAPLLDLNARPQPYQPMRIDAAPQRPRSQPAPPPTVAPAAPSRPAPATPLSRAAPVAPPTLPPSRPAPPRSEGAPLREIPMEPIAPKKKEPPVARPVPPPRRAAEMQPAPAKPSGGWLNVMLVAVVAALALAVGAFALARPFMPAEWLR